MKGQVACRCGCGAANVAPGFLEKIAQMEKQLGFELVALSVCRCEKHNKAESGEPHSEHLATARHDCCAVDIESPADNWPLRVQITKAARAAGFHGFGHANSFLHIDLGRMRFWFYPSFLKRHPALCPWKDPVP